MEINKCSSNVWDTKGFPFKDAHFMREFINKNVMC